jgi:hypothetical protein
MHTFPFLTAFCNTITFTLYTVLLNFNAEINEDDSLLDNFHTTRHARYIKTPAQALVFTNRRSHAIERRLICHLERVSDVQSLIEPVPYVCTKVYSPDCASVVVSHVFISCANSVRIDVGHFWSKKVFPFLWQTSNVLSLAIPAQARRLFVTSLIFRRKLLH